MLKQEMSIQKKRGKHCSKDSLNVAHAFIRNLVYSVRNLNNGTIATAHCQDYWYTNNKKNILES